MTLGEAKLRDLPRIGLNAALVLCAGMSGCARSGELGVPVEPDRKASADRRASRSRDLPFTTTLNLEVIEAGQDADRGELTMAHVGFSMAGCLRPGPRVVILDRVC